ncbi:spore germination protein [Paenibacillus alkaliterrae]|uniref:spore germination protein n=1 Tax=Paenibacillus alkaliterrae TaxID=320909 RepID=UPI001F324C34|nr:spore germination protein [Paenibacillus alkaliterrae]MCF2937957.1 spore germination protein [Paenibacillus alkaliterrae]
MKPDDTAEHNVLISSNLSDNQQRIAKVFANCIDIKYVVYRYGPELIHTALVVHCETLTQDKKLNYLKSALQDLTAHEVGAATAISPEEVINFFGQHGVSTHSADIIEQFDQAVKNVLNGYVVIFLDQWNKALSFHSLYVESRTVSESVNEPVVKGPHDSTVEDLKKNIGLLRARLKTSDFKIEMFIAGKKTNAEVAFGYLEEAVDPEMLAEFKRRIEKVKKEEILETSFIEELIEDSTYSPFPQYRYTERPDVAVAALLDGKIIVMVSGTPSVMICPGLFVEFFSSSEDYYQRTVFASLVRLMRLVAFFLALALPSIYIALSTFHPELIPTVLLLAIKDTREGIPFPAFVEALIMVFFFEILREAGIRLPRPVGSAVSIVGALVIGQAAIQAKIASPIMVIVVALTGIASFSLPQYTLTVALRTMQFPLMALAASLGGFGLMIGFLLTLLHLTCLRSLGQPYLSTLAPLRPKQLRDVFIRAPLKILLRSPRNRYLHKKPGE